MCNKLSYYASQSLTSFLQAKNEIERLTIKIQEFCNINLKGKNLATYEAISPHQVCDPNIMKTKRNPGKIASHIKKRRQCSRCKRVGHTIRKCPQSRIPHTINDSDMVCKILYALLINVKILLWLHL